MGSSGPPWFAVLSCGLPGLVAVRATGPAWAESGGNGGRLVGEEDAGLRIATASNGSQRRGTVESPIDLRAAVAAPQPRARRGEGAAIGAEEDIGLHGHQLALMQRRGRPVPACVALRTGWR